MYSSHEIILKNTINESTFISPLHWYTFDDTKVDEMYKFTTVYN